MLIAGNRPDLARFDIPAIADLDSGSALGGIKHDVHRFSIDHEGKDSWRLTQAGADTMLVTSADKLAMVKQHPGNREPVLADTIANYCRDVDIVLTEGFKRSQMPRLGIWGFFSAKPGRCWP